MNATLSVGVFFLLPWIWQSMNSGEFSIEADSCDSCCQLVWNRAARWHAPYLTWWGRNQTIHTLKWQKIIHVKRCRSCFWELAVIYLTTEECLCIMSLWGEVRMCWCGGSHGFQTGPQVQSTPRFPLLHYGPSWHQDETNKWLIIGGEMDKLPEKLM